MQNRSVFGHWQHPVLSRQTEDLCEVCWASFKRALSLIAAFIVVAIIVVARYGSGFFQNRRHRH
jgi:hypothetical protein